MLLRSALGPGTSLGEWIIAGLLLAWPFSYVVGIVLGLPAFLLLRRFGWLKLGLVSLAGGFVRVLSGVFLLGTRPVVLVAPCGLGVLLFAAVFWYIVCWQLKPLRRAR